MKSAESFSPDRKLSGFSLKKIMIFNRMLLERAYLETREFVPPKTGAKGLKRRRNALDKAF